MASTIISHFEIPEDQEGNFRAKCKHCPSVISGSKQVTSNFVTHMKRKHRDIYISSIEAKVQTDQPKLTTVFNQPSKKYSNNDPRQKQLTDALVMFVAGDLLPLSVVESENFKNLLEIADPKYQLPSRKHLSSKLLHEKSVEVINDLKSLLQKATSVCLTIDIWSSRQMRSFLGISGHFILDWTIKSVMLCCKRFKGRHTSENIRNEYEETIAAYELGDKIISLVSDNASNMVKAFSLPGYETITKTHDENDVSNDDDDENSDDEDTDDEIDDVSGIFPQHSRCFAHSLQLVVKDGFKECNSHLKGIIAKASKIVSFVRKSTLASELLEDEKKLQTANETRWNSQLNMIRSVLNIPETKLNLVDCNMKLSTYERKLLTELCYILEPFEKVTNLVQGEAYVTSSLAIPCTLGLKHQLSKMLSVYNCKMVSTLQKSVSDRLSNFENENMYKLASMLDPRFKLRWAETNVDENINILKIKVSEIQSQQSLDEEINDSPPKKKLKSDDFFSFMPTHTPKKKRHVSGNVDEIDKYFSEPCIEMSLNPLDYWKNVSNIYPHLANLARKYLAIQATSAAVERIFSIAGKTFRPDRCSMKDSTFETLMTIKCNMKGLNSTTK